MGGGGGGQRLTVMSGMPLVTSSLVKEISNISVVFEMALE